jgi:hypothetical protein
MLRKSLTDALRDETALVSTDLNALVRSNVNALRRQITHDRFIATTKLAVLAPGRQQLGWDNLFKLVQLDQDLLKKVEAELSVIIGDESWHLQGTEEDYPAVSLVRLGELSGVPERRLREALLEKERPKSLGRNFTLEEVVAIAAATDTSLQQLLTPPWQQINRLTIIGGHSVQYLSGKPSVELDRWLSWLYGMEPLPFQNDFLFERNNSYSLPFGKRFDSIGRAVHKNTKSGSGDIETFNEDGMFSRASWFKMLNSNNVLGQNLPSEADGKYVASSLLGAPFKGAYIVTGLMTQIRKLLRLARKKGQSARLDSHWILTSTNSSFLMGRLARLRRIQAKR